jgi:hypothetical protein
MIKSEAYTIKAGWIMLFGLFCLAFICFNNDNCKNQESVTTAIQINAERLQQNVSLPAHYALLNVQVPVAETVSFSENHLHILLNRSLQETRHEDILLKTLHDRFFIQYSILPCIRSVCSPSPDDPSDLG